MEKVDRRNLILASGLGLAVAGCGRGVGSLSQGDNVIDPCAAEKKSGLSVLGEKSPFIGFQKIEPAGIRASSATNNVPLFGLDPQKPHPGLGAKQNPDGTQPMPGPAQPFAPLYVAIFHFDLEFGDNATTVLNVRSAHCTSIAGGTNDFDANQVNIANVINYFNGNEVKQPQCIIKERSYANFGKLNFNAPHHLIIYMKNVSLYKDFPVFFGNQLISKDNAEKNGSFFDAKVQDIKGVNPGPHGPCAQKILYMKNYFHYYDELNGVQEIKDKSAHWHSMNIVATLVAGDLSPIVLPVIIDPDTGNMGGGIENP